MDEENIEEILSVFAGEPIDEHFIRHVYTVRLCDFASAERKEMVMQFCAEHNGGCSLGWDGGSVQLPRCANWQVLTFGSSAQRTWNESEPATHNSWS
jgi:hypothetical protein